MPATKDQHLDPARAPKRILSLDGGGIRGFLTLQYLEALEALLRRRIGRADLVLSDYFDLIGGTSTGAILAATLACGMSVSQVLELYNTLGEEVFKESFIRVPLLAPKFPSDPLQNLLNETLGSETTLGDDKVRTGLMVMTKRLDTGSPWPLTNHPKAAYATQDRALKLTDVVRASTAAPTYFKPEQIAIHSRDGTVTTGAFVDGGVTPFNDPALQLLILTALEGYGFCWQRGEDKLLIVSVGTGTADKERFSTDRIMHMTAVEQGLRSLQSLMDDCTRINQTQLQWLTKCLTPWNIDRAVKDMRNDGQTGPKLATYVRYNVLLNTDWLQKTIARTYSADDLTKIAQMDNPKNLQQLGEIGRAAAKVQILPEHFPPAFDITRE